MNYNTPKLNQKTNDKWAQFDTLSDHLRGHCKHQTEESMSEYKKYIGQGNDMMIDAPSTEELLAERNSAALGDGVQSFAIPRSVIKGEHPEPHEDFAAPETEPIQPAMLEMQEVVDGLPESGLQTYKDQMLSEISDREAIVDAINRRLDAVQAKQYTGGVRSAITKQVKL
ncbi:MAG: hypothetical protein HXK06_00050 [Actinomyces graevenitzii]|nr:hypothetical protein [Actinomyces graevenitzii]